MDVEAAGLTDREELDSSFDLAAVVANGECVLSLIFVFHTVAPVQHPVVITPWDHTR